MRAVTLYRVVRGSELVLVEGFANVRFGSIAASQQFNSPPAAYGCDINWSMQHIEQSVLLVFDILTSF